MKIINPYQPKEDREKLKSQSEKKRINQTAIYSAIAVFMLFAIGVLIFALSNKPNDYNTGVINDTEITSVIGTPTSTPPITPIISPTSVSETTSASPTIIPSQVLSYGQMKDLVDKTKSETSWPTPAVNSFDWLNNCTDSSKSTDKVNGFIIQTTVDFTKSGAQKTIDDIQGYFQNLNFTTDQCNSADGVTKQLRAYKNKTDNKRVIVTYDSKYIDAPDPNYPPSGKKVSETVTIQYE